MSFFTSWVEILIHWDWPLRPKNSIPIIYQICIIKQLNWHTPVATISLNHQCSVFNADQLSRTLLAVIYFFSELNFNRFTHHTAKMVKSSEWSIDTWRAYFKSVRTRIIWSISFSSAKALFAARQSSINIPLGLSTKICRMRSRVGSIQLQRTRNREALVPRLKCE